MSEEKVVRNIFRAENHWLSVYWCMKEAAEWGIGWWDKERFGILLSRLMLVYRPPPARFPKGSPIMSAKSCAWSITGAACAVAAGLLLLFLLGVSWRIVAGLAASAVIFGLGITIVAAFLDWRVE